ncbi:MAG: hypothetical protein JRJ24_18815 [Deltaproteobacteria bacterium]|nr:hypothetical protein [Deltaproteobacteria bacterium]
MMRAEILRFVVPTLPAVFLAVFLGGCSLVVDFDRSLLVDAGVDAGLDAAVDAGEDAAVDAGGDAAPNAR